MDRWRARSGPYGYILHANLDGISSNPEKETPLLTVGQCMVILLPEMS